MKRLTDIEQAVDSVLGDVFDSAISDPDSEIEEGPPKREKLSLEAVETVSILAISSAELAHHIA